MARNNTLGQLLDLYRSEARLSVNPAHNSQVRDTQVRLLARVYEQLWEDYDWPHLNIEREYQLQDGERLYDFGVDFDLSRIVRLSVKDGGDWVPLRTRIGGREYSLYDSARDERAWPARAWRVFEDEKIEIWPIPDQNGDAATHDGYLKVEGIAQRPPFVDDADICVLDGRMIALYAAAETLLGGDKTVRLGQLKLNMADARKLRLTGNMNKTKTTKMFARPEPQPCSRDFPVYRTGDAT